MNRRQFLSVSAILASGKQVLSSGISDKCEKWWTEHHFKFEDIDCTYYVIPKDRVMVFALKDNSRFQVGASFLHPVDFVKTQSFEDELRFAAVKARTEPNLEWNKHVPTGSYFRSTSVYNGPLYAAIVRYIDTDFYGFVFNKSPLVPVVDFTLNMVESYNRKCIRYNRSESECKKIANVWDNQIKNFIKP